MSDSRSVRRTTPEVEKAARDLRRNMTPAEETLWKALRYQRVGGLRFRRQHPVGRFVLDFYCPSVKLAIEVDGGIHDQQRDRDEERIGVMNAAEIRVLRFRNEEVLNDLPSVLRRIRSIGIDRK